MSGLLIDCFAGGGGASKGIELALNRPIDIAIQPLTRSPPPSTRSTTPPPCT